MTWFSQLTELYESKKAIGQKVTKTGVVPAATGTDALFTISGGRVRLTGLVGQVSVLVDNAAHGAMNVMLTHTPTTGPAVATPMCAVLNVVTDNVHTVYTITGVVGGAMADDGRRGVIVPSFVTNRQVLQPGLIELDLTSAEIDCGGTIVWTLFYEPIDDAAVVAAAP